MAKCCNSLKQTKTADTTKRQRRHDPYWKKDSWRSLSKWKPEDMIIFHKSTETINPKRCGISKLRWQEQIIDHDDGAPSNIREWFDRGMNKGDLYDALKREFITIEKNEKRKHTDDSNETDNLMGNCNIYSYILREDWGGAPCIENGLLSLAICKPAIRRTAKKGDWITMFAGAKIAGKGVRDRLYCMFEVSDVITMQEYGENHTNRMDCIFDQNLEYINKIGIHGDKYLQERDLRGKNVLLSTNFIFFGKMDNNTTTGIEIDKNFKDMIPYGKGHQNQKNKKFREELPKYFENLSKKYGKGKIGKHFDKKYKDCGKKNVSIKC